MWALGGKGLCEHWGVKGYVCIAPHVCCVLSHLQLMVREMFSVAVRILDVSPRDDPDKH